MSDENMLQEAISAARKGEKARARDLLTRLLRKDQNQPEYWYWMSGVVETQREQIFCLENLLRIQPDNKFAKRSLILLGTLPPDDSLIPPPANRAVKWTVNTGSETKRTRPSARTLLKFAGYLGLLAGLVGLLFFGVFGLNTLTAAPPPQPTPNFLLTSTYIVYATLTPTITPTPSPTPTPAEDALLIPEPTALADLLDVPYTPTPVLVNTPHTEEAYRNANLARQRGNWEEAIQSYLQVSEAQPEAADIQYHLGMAYMQLGEYQKALAAFLNAGRLDGNFGPAFIGQALARYALDPTTNVENEFATAEKVSPDYAPLYLERARIRIAQGNMAEVENDLALALEQMPYSPEVYLLNAQYLEYQGEYALAKEAAQKALELDLTLVPAYFVLAKAHLELGEIAEGTARLEQYAWYSNFDPEAMRMLGKIYTETEQYAKAISTLNEVIKADERDAEAFYLRGLAYLATGENEQALEDFTAANQLRRGRLPYNLGMARGYYATEAYADAYYQLEQTLPLAVTDAEKAEVYFLRAQTQQALGRLPGAVEDLKRVVLLEESISAELLEDTQALLETLEAAIAATQTATAAPLTPTGTASTPTPTATARP